MEIGQHVGRMPKGGEGIERNSEEEEMEGIYRISGCNGTGGLRAEIEIPMEERSW